MKHPLHRTTTQKIRITIELLLRPFPLTTNHLVYLTYFVTSRAGQSLPQRNWFLLIIHPRTFTFRMTGRSSADDALISIESCLVQPPTLVWAIAARLQVNRSKVPRGLAHDVEAAIVLDVAYFQIDAKLGHGPLLAELTGNALSLQNRSAAANFFDGNFQTQITVRRRNCVITRAVAGDIKLLIVARPSMITIECLDPDSGRARAVRDFQTTPAGLAHDRVHALSDVPCGSFVKGVRMRAGARPK